MAVTVPRDKRSMIGRFAQVSLTRMASMFIVTIPSDLCNTIAYSIQVFQFAGSC